MGVMQDGGAREKNSPAGWNPAAVRCDYCKSMAALIFCTTESAFMCMTCDVTLHVDMSSKHERVWICRVCEQAPAKFSCKADAAALCVTCDRNIHSVNPLASHHERFPIAPFYDIAESMIKLISTKAPYLLPVNHLSCIERDKQNVIDCWTSSNPITSKLSTEMELFAPNLDRFDTFENPNEINFAKSNIDSYNCSISTPSLSVSSSSLDVGVVPDGSSYADSSLPFTLITSIKAAKASPIVGIDREARVLRYKEKRKKRNFDKTIRYASRKAYAESRPRIKGRFAKRTEAQTDTNRLIFSSFFSVDDAGFGAVPSF